MQEIYTYKQGVKWATQMAAGLAYLHENNPMIIHRDIKLENVLLSGGAHLFPRNIGTPIGCLNCLDDSANGFVCAWPQPACVISH